jgi:hypothetical protein
MSPRLSDKELDERRGRLLVPWAKGKCARCGTTLCAGPLEHRRHLIRFPRFPEMEAFQFGDLRAIGSTDVEPDGTAWRHVSISCADRYPTWDELKDARYRFFDEEAEVVQFFPPRSEYVNLHRNTFHLWHRLDGRRLIPMP